MRLPAIIAASFALVATARAADGGNIQRFAPEAATLGGLATAPGEILGLGDYALGLDLDWAHNPLVRREYGERVAATVANDVTAHLRAAVGLHEVFELGLELPVVAFANGDDADAPVAGGAVGDLKLHPRVRLMTQWKHGLALSITPTVIIPLGATAALAGDKGVGIVPTVSVSRVFTKLTLGGNLSFRLRKEQLVVPGARLGNEVGLRFYAGFAVDPDTHLLGELDGGLALATLDAGVLGNPLELRAGLRHFLGDTMAVDFGAGTALLSAPGTPDVRVVAGLVYGRGLRPKPGTACVREEADGPKPMASRGVDVDGDGVDDACDLCLDGKETVNGEKDTDGCPDGDQDLDGVLDHLDRCPALAGSAPTGCPDKDGDGVFDDVDRCLDKKEDVDEFQDDDGCPELDNDKDDVPDAKDRCPMSPEDLDGFEDQDGCPENDNDSDGILDRNDRCPSEKETINGYEDEDGCPDKGKTLVVVKAEKIEILEKVYFATGHDVIEERSYGLLKQVALTLKAHQAIKQIRIEGHTDDVGGHDYNVDLSQRRAEAVRFFLVSEGVDDARLVAQGFASDRPLVPNDGEQNRATNRRVEFVIVNDEVQP